MIYLDYSATTPVNEEVLNTFVEVNKKFIRFCRVKLSISEVITLDMGSFLLQFFLFC